MFICLSIIPSIWLSQSSWQLFWHHQVDFNLNSHICSVPGLIVHVFGIFRVHWFSAELLPFMHWFFNGFVQTFLLPPPCRIQLNFKHIFFAYSGSAYLWHFLINWFQQSYCPLCINFLYNRALQKGEVPTLFLQHPWAYFSQTSQELSVPNLDMHIFSLFSWYISAELLPLMHQNSYFFNILGWILAKPH